jgi:large subunit ribosomal protein L23
MALFSKKEDTKKTKEEQKDIGVPSEKSAAVAPKAATDKKDEKVKEKKAKKPAKDAGANLMKPPVHILKAPRITEKAVYMTVNNVYVFEIAQDATKRDVIAAVQALYNVKPRKVNIVRKRPRSYVARFRNRKGKKRGLKKAYVFLKKGEKIDLV